jgi:hypothetical protein
MKSSVFIPLCALLCFATACTVKEAVEDLTPTPFIQKPEELHKPQYTPFDLGWISPDVANWMYDTLTVEAVKTEYVNPDNWIFSAGTLMPTRASYMRQVNELADYIQKRVSKEFENYNGGNGELSVEKGLPVEPLPQNLPKELRTPAPPQVPIEPLEGDRKRELILDISIADANFGDPLVYGGLLAVPVPGIANLSTAVKSPSLTLEARFIDKTSGEVVMELVDRRFPQLKIVDINRLTVSSALREIVDSFASDLVKSFYRKHGEKVGKRWPFSLLPW